MLAESMRIKREGKEEEEKGSMQCSKPLDRSRGEAHSKQLSVCLLSVDVWFAHNRFHIH